MKASELLSSAWQQVQIECGQTQGYFYRRLHLPEYFTAYAGIVHPGGSRRLSLEFPLRNESQLPPPEDSRGYALLCAELPGCPAGVICLHLTEVNPAFSTMFGLLCVDILDQWRRGRTPAQALSAVLHRLKLWRRFFQQEQGLSRQEYVGLYAELVVLGKLVSSGVDPDIAVEAWSGPLGTNQDFTFGTVALEVKASTGNETDSINIANERQLDGTGLSDLFLCHFAYDFRKDAGQTLANKIGEIASQIAQSESAALAFDERLLAAGYRPEVHSPWEAHGFTERKRAFFRIDEPFPRIIEAQLAPGISHVSYRIDLAACVASKTQFGKVINTLEALKFHD